VKSTGKGGAPPIAPGAAIAEDSPNPPFVSGRYEVALIEGTVRGPNGDFRAARAAVERLANDIGQLDGFRVEMAESPLDTGAGMEISGHLQEHEPATMDSRFVLRVVHESERKAT
jgi:hypothetical protein